MSSNGGWIEAAIFDDGGVLTRPGRQAIAQWTCADRFHAQVLSTPLREALSQQAPAGTRIPQPEIREPATEDFDHALTERFRTEDGVPVVAGGPTSRLFAQAQTEPRMHDLVRQALSAGIRTALLPHGWRNDYPWDEIDDLFAVAVISGEFGISQPTPACSDSRWRSRAEPAARQYSSATAPSHVETAERLELHAIPHKESETIYVQLATLIPDMRHTLSTH